MLCLIADRKRLLGLVDDYACLSCRKIFTCNEINRGIKSVICPDCGDASVLPHKDARLVDSTKEIVHLKKQFELVKTRLNQIAETIPPVLAHTMERKRQIALKTLKEIEDKNET